MVRSLVISVHDFRSRRKASVHFLTGELAKRGPVRFFSVGLSRLSEHRGDTRADLKDRANRAEVVDGVQCYLYRTLWHPFTLRKPALLPLERILFRAYRLTMPAVFRHSIRWAEVVFVESGMAAIFIPDIRRLNPKARIVYLASDDLSVIGAAETIKRGFATHFDEIDTVRLPSRFLLDSLPHGRSAIFAPHGIDRTLTERSYDSPYGPRQGCVSVGSMLFDADFFNIAARLFPELDFHIIGAGKAAAKLDARANIIIHEEMPFSDTLPYVRHAALGVAPYLDAGTPRYLIDTSLKLKQFGLFGIPAVCPYFALGDAPGRFGYRPGDAATIESAIRAALAHDTPITIDAPGWSDILDRLLTPERFPEHRLHPAAG